VIEHEKKMRQEAHAKEYLQPPPSGRSRYYNTWLLGEIPTAITTDICAGSSGDNKKAVKASKQLSAICPF
jgi:hypothetical protein